MNAHEALVERIVKEVTAALGRQDAKANDPTSPQPTPTKVIDHNVITAETLEGSINGDRNVLIGSRSVLTPSARDYLRHQGISWERATNEQTKPTGLSRWMAIVVQSTSAISTALEQNSNDWIQTTAADDGEAANAAVSAICRSDADGVVVISGHPEVVACRANRNPKIRAAVVKDGHDTKSVQHTLGVNVFCIDPDERAFFEMRNLLNAIATGPLPHPPNGWPDE